MKGYVPGMKTYAEKLRDPRWQRKRSQIMKRADFKCEDCGNTTDMQSVHHCFYIAGREPWEYEDNELRCLCEICHEDRAIIEHDFVLQVKRAMALLPFRNLYDLFELMRQAEDGARMLASLLSQDKNK
ncbi:MAG TPA: hypothetical protein VF333_09970 [Pyrinomonadaceae bacterium]